MNSAFFSRLLLTSLVLASSTFAAEKKSSWAIWLGEGAQQGQSLQALQRRPPDLLVLDPDTHAPFTLLPSQSTKMAYLSIGEAEDRRPYWNKIKNASFLLRENKTLEGKIAADLRDPEWQRILLKEEAPRAQAQGFRGFYLDGLDALVDLENTDGVRFGGLKKAIGAFLQKFREQYPQGLLLVSGSSALEVAAPYVDGLVAEGLFSVWDPETKRYRKTFPEERDVHFKQIENALVTAGRPVYTLDEVDPKRPAAAKPFAREARQRGYQPFLSDNLQSDVYPQLLN